MGITTLDLEATLGRGKNEEYKDDKNDNKYGDKDHGKDHDDDNGDKYGQKDGEHDDNGDKYGQKDGEHDDKGDKYGQKDDKNDYKDQNGKDYGEREDHDSYADHNYSHYGKYIVGTKGDDKLFGGKGNDYLDGRKGNDKLFGDGGNDTLYGGKGDDYLVGGKGDDKIDGGKGDDKIVFSGVDRGSNGFDKILNFESGEDTLVFSLKDVNDAIKGYKNDLDHGKLDDDNFASNKWGKAEDKDDYFVYNEHNGVLSFDADGSGYHDATALAQLVGAPELEAGDIFLA
jgi:Ca2+-binding RTX toxin-like protein